MENKLIFPLCKLCAEQRNQHKCKHSDTQRELTGTWCTPELVEAEKRGYKIVKIFEIYHWNETTKYDPKTGEAVFLQNTLTPF